MAPTTNRQDASDREDDLIQAAQREADDLQAASAPTRTTHHAGTPDSECPADLVPGYRITREIHRGGQGVVYQAVHHGTRRTVALKVIREGPFAGGPDKIRFEREMHILAQLSHPRIVGIHDSGSAAGSFYFVMDYISGQQLDQYIHCGDDPIERVLRLFVLICEAVNAAHLQGVIHRDLKPSNIRVDADGEPHILDFGLAKMAAAEMSEASQEQVMSITGQFLGSLPWASPDQAQGLTHNIDVRTDVYSLGVILYQLLTGRFPYTVVGHMADVLDNIRQADPIRPSTIRPQIDDEVETIVLKCLAKERERRYQSAGELGRDIEHYLAGEPIEAKRDSGWYVLRKTLSRYKLPVFVVAAFVVLSAVFGVTMSVLYKRALLAEVQARQIGGTLEEMVELLDSSGPNDADERRRLEEFAAEIDRDPPPDPKAEALIRAVIGRTFKEWSEYARAKPQLEAALDIRRQLFGDQHPKVAQSLHDLGSLHYRLGNYQEARELYQQAVEMRRTLLGPAHADVASSLNDLAGCHARLGEHQTAEQLYGEVLELRRRLFGDQHPEVADTLNNLAASLIFQGRWARAEPHLRQSLEMMLKFREDKHQYVLQTRHNIARCLIELDEFEQAAKILYDVLDKKEERWGQDHISVARSRHLLAEVEYYRGDTAKAEQYCRQALQVKQSKLPASHRSIAVSLHLLGLIQMDHGEVNAAERSLQRALTIRLAEPRDDDWKIADTQSALGACMVAMGRFAEAEDLLVGSYVRLDDAMGSDHRRTIQALDRIIDLYEAWPQPDRAAQYRALRSESPPAAPESQ